ncbi:MAG: hypothetical protein LBU22_02380 [Dysgonamonadaceae bacterium]|jgi:hypothetical protein|nr:hypothetical protein [Dysgonamonadaceae bacterium]
MLGFFKKKIHNGADNEIDTVSEEEIIDGNGENLVEDEKPIDRLEILFKYIENVHAEDKTVECKIAFFKDGLFLARIRKIYCDLPLHLMPWEYGDEEYWRIIAPSLCGKVFKCKVTEVTRLENKRIQVQIDASEHEFREVELVENAEYTGILLQKLPDGLLIDIGVQFYWKYGPLAGIIYASDFESPELFDACEAGQTINVRYLGEGENFYRFAPLSPDEPYSEYIGRIVWVRVCKSGDAAMGYLVENKYKAALPVTKAVYPDGKRILRKMRNEWKDGDIINCEVVDFKPKKGFILKFADTESLDENSWITDEIIDYIGKKVDVYVHKENGKTKLLIDDKYPAIMTGKYVEKLHELYDGDIIECKVGSVDIYKRFFRIK